MAAACWDIYCRVIDNLGDAGVCWRLAAGLAARSQRVRLVIDDPSPLRFMAPQGAAGVEVMPWPGPPAPGDIVVEAFGCDPPPAVVATMSQRRPPPVWINLEYLSAEAYVERSHGLPSPQPNGLTKWFYYPGFTPRTGGLLREAGLQASRALFERDVWLRQHGIGLQPAERVVALFCYDNPALPALLHDLARRPTLLLATPGLVQRQLDTLPAPPAPLRIHRLPWLDQAGFDRLLWSADLNFVRGEDSLLRAVWAGAPFVWQAYPQDDGAHQAKVDAMLERLQPGPAVAAAWRAWNAGGAIWPGLAADLDTPDPAFARWRQAQLERPDLVTQLIAFALAKAAPAMR